jgi:hypothetical protein
MGEHVHIAIAREFSAYPSGRDEKDGPYNGKRFREELLFPRLTEAFDRSVPLVVSLDGVMSFGSSFLEEAFGGLVRVSDVDKLKLQSALRIDEGRPSNRRYKDAILRYISDAV